MIMNKLLGNNETPVWHQLLAFHNVALHYLHRRRTKASMDFWPVGEFV